jgi:flagellar hook-associated protein 2
MSAITTGVGLASGIDIAGTVDKLIAISAKPRDMLTDRNKTFTEQQAAVTTLAALLTSVQYVSNNLGKADLYQQRTVASNAPTALAATLTGNPAIGTYEYTPLRMAQAQKLLSSGFKSDSQPIGAGTMTVRFGDRVDRSASLSVINAGQGFVRGKLRIADGNGNSADIDLSTAQTVDDVLEAINGNQTVNVTASTQNGRFHLVDNTGGALHLKVQEIGAGTTAASLGLAGIDSATGAADGQNILALDGDIDLSSLNDGTGVEISPTLGDIKYTLRNGESGEIDFAAHDNTTMQGTPETTLQELIDHVNSQTGGKLKLEIAADGNSLTLTDTTTGSGSFTLQSAYGSLALHDLGLDAGAVNGVVTAAADVVAGRRILGGLKTVTLGSLNGGAGLGTLGTVSITDRTGASATVDLQNAQTLDDVVAAFNAAGVRISAQVNRAGNGIELLDTSGSTSGSMVVADADATNTATKLNLATAAGATGIAAVNSGDMHLKVVGENTLLASLNGGAGAGVGQFTIADTHGAKGTIDLRSAGIKTVGDLVRAVNRLGLTAQAELNATGDGILLNDTSGGGGMLTVAEVGSGTSAKALGLRRDAKTNGTEQTIDGSLTYKFDIWDNDTLANLKTQINQLGAGFSAAIITDGTNRPYHLSLTSGRAGKAGAMVVDTSAANFTFNETAKAQDSLLLLGPRSAAATAALSSAASNSFSNVVDGIRLDIKQALGQTVSVSVDATSTNLAASAKVFVDNYNKFRDKYDELTKFDTSTNTGAVLNADGSTLRLGTDLAQLLSGRFTGVGKYESLAAVGISFTQDGHLQLDDAKFNAAVSDDPTAIKDFFTTKDKGVSAKLGAMLEQIAGKDKSLVSERLATLDSKIAANTKRIAELNTRLDTERTRLLTSFYNMELAISKFQSSLKSLDSIQWMLNGNLYSNGSSKSSGN